MGHNVITRVTGDFNMQVGTGADGEEVGRYELGKRNSRGDMLLQACKETELCIANTMFSHHPRHRYMWTAPAEEVCERSIRTHMNYIMVRKSFTNGLLNTGTHPSADFYSDHKILVMTLSIKLKRMRRPERTAKLDNTKLLTPSGAQ